MSRAPLVTRAPATAILLLTLLVSTLSLSMGALLDAVLAAPAQAHTGPATRTSTSGTPRTATDTATTPLKMTITSLSPTAIPRKGAITISGVLSNASKEDWSDVNVYPFVSTTPITSRDDLALAAATQDDADVGPRLTDSRTMAPVGDLSPGDTVPFSLRIPVASLGISGDPGVYWIGVHALGASSKGRDRVADGRARTFIPLLPRGRTTSAPVPVSLVLSLRERVRRDAEGRVAGPTRWTRLTGPEGRLTHLTDLAASAGTAPVSWVVDPAVLDALDDLARGNRKLALGPRRGSGSSPDASPSASEPGSGSGSPSGSPTASASPSAEPSSPASPPTPDASAQGRASAVLDQALSSIRGNDLLRLGYADPDTVALARRKPSLLTRADQVAGRSMEARDLQGARAVVPPDGFFDPDLLDRLPRDAVMLLADQGRDRGVPPSTRLPTGQQLVLADSRASAGGPGPSRTYDALAVRQRVLADAALEQLDPSLDGAPRPIVVQLPTALGPRAFWRSADFFGALEQRPGSALTPLQHAATTTFDGSLPYGRAQLRGEIGEANVAATRLLAHTGTVFGHLLASENDVSDTLVGAALATSSYNARSSRRIAVRQAQDLDGLVPCPDGARPGEPRHRLRHPLGRVRAR